MATPGPVRDVKAFWKSWPSLSGRMGSAVKTLTSWRPRLFSSMILVFIGVVGVVAVIVHGVAVAFAVAVGFPLSAGLLTALVYPLGEELGKFLAAQKLVPTWRRASSAMPYLGIAAASLCGVAAFSLAESLAYLACPIVQSAPPPLPALCHVPHVSFSHMLVSRMLAAPGHIVHAIPFVVAAAEARRHRNGLWNLLPALGLGAAIASHVLFNVASLIYGIPGVVAWWRLGVITLALAAVYFGFRPRADAVSPDSALPVG